MKFKDYPFHPALLGNLEKNGFKKPTDIQFKTIRPVMKGEDVLAIAQTGTGKTAAYLIPVIQLLLEDKKKLRGMNIFCLILVPTRELSLQVFDIIQTLASGTEIKAANLLGGVEQDSQVAAVKSGAQIMVSTPGRLFDLLHQGHVDLSNMEILVVDEADRMLNAGFFKDITDLLRHIPNRRQTLFFSATIDSEIKKLAYKLVKNAIRIQISPDNPVNKNINHSVAYIEMDDKRFFLERLINEIAGIKMMIFVRTKVRAERVSKAMERAGIKSETIHSGKEQIERNTALNNLKENKNQILIATDVSARGIDIEGIGYVVNYDIPELAENYVHRVGRTGRGRSRGIAVSFCSSEEKPLLKNIEEYIGEPIRELKINRDEYQETVGFSADESVNDWRSLMKEDSERSKKTK